MNLGKRLFGRVSAIAPSYVWAMAAITILWTTNQPLTKWVLPDIPPLTFAWLRFSVTALVLLPFARSQPDSKWTAADLRQAVVMGLVGITLAQVANNVSLGLTDASHTVVISSTVPIFVAGLAALVLRERLPGRGWLGLAVSFAGVGLLIASAPDARKATSPDPLLGDLVSIAAYVGWTTRSPVPGMARALAALLAAPAAVLCVVGFAILAYQLSYHGRIRPGVYVLNLNVGGMSPVEARALVARQFAAYSEQPVRLIAGDRAWDLTPTALGLRSDVDIAIRAAYRVGRTGAASEQLAAMMAALRRETVAVDLPLLVDGDHRDRQIARIAREIDRPVIDARITLGADLRPVLHPSQVGRKLDTGRLRAAVDGRLGAMSGESVVLAVAETPPRVPAEMIAGDFNRLQQAIASPFTVRAAERSWTLQPWEIAAAIQLRAPSAGSPAFQFDEARLRAFAVPIAREIDAPPVDARIALRGGEPVVIRPSREGRAVDVDGLVAALQRALPGPTRTLAVPVRSVRPAFAAEDRNVFRDAAVVAEAKTSYEGSIPERAHNVELATARLNGVVVPPGKTFSFNDELGPTTLKSGFQIGWGITSSGEQVETVPSVAGGICQVSTTLFQAVFWSGYPVEERNYHLYWIPRYGQPPLGMKGLDATVDAPTVDFKFTNSTTHPLLIQTRTDGKYVSFSLHGVKPAWQVTVEGPVVDQIVKAVQEPVRQEDPTAPAGKELWIEHAEDGFRATIIRTVVEGTDRRVLRLVSTYRPSRNVLLVGTRGNS